MAKPHPERFPAAGGALRRAATAICRALPRRTAPWFWALPLVLACTLGVIDARAQWQYRDPSWVAAQGYDRDSRRRDGREERREERRRADRDQRHMLTPDERRQLRRDLERANREIYRQGRERR